MIKKANPTANIKAIDHENPLIKEPIDIYKSEESMNQINQKYSDFLFSKYEISVDGITTIINKYIDKKSDYKGPAKGHITTIHGMDSDVNVFKERVNDLRCHCNKILLGIKDNKSITKATMNMFINELNIIHKNVKANNLIQFNQDFIELLANNIFTQEFKDILNLSFSNSSKKDALFLEYLDTIKYNIDKYLDSGQFKIEDFYSNKHAVRHRCMFEILENCFPKEAVEEVKNRLLTEC